MFRLMEKARKNNKGFSLVELIVVVLIIAIIAVALAPQVVKYVGKARTNVEANNAATIKSAVQAAVAEYEGDNGTITGTKTYTVTQTKASSGKVTTTVTGPDDPAALKTLISNNIGNDQLDGKSYTIKIDGEQVTVTY